MNLIIIMTTYHRPNDFQRSLTSILQHTPELGKLYILDNSCGWLNPQLAQITDPRVIIHRSPTNLGKGKIVRENYQAALQHTDLDHFIGMDSDIVVQPGWYPGLLAAARRVAPWAAMAPLIRDPGQDLDPHAWPITGMHYVVGPTEWISEDICYNPATAGPLFLIRRKFWENWGGYPGTQLYGRDDGALCKEALRRGQFIGFTTNVVVEHSNIDCPLEYGQWKWRNANGDVDHKGYWD